MSTRTTRTPDLPVPAPRGALSGWAQDVGAVPSPAARPSTEVSPAGLRAVATAVVAAPLAMTAWFLVEPAVLPREEPAVFLASVASAPDRYLLATGFVALAGALSVVSALGLWALLRARLPRLSLVLALVTVLSGLGLWAQAGFRLFVLSGVRDGAVPDSALAGHAAFQAGGLFDLLLLPALAAGAVGSLVFFGALLRTRVVPAWVPAALLAGAVLASGEFADPVTVGGAALGAVGNLAVARALLRGPA